MKTQAGSGSGEIGAAVAFRCGAGASQVTETSVVVDGGMLPMASVALHPSR